MYQISFNFEVDILSVVLFLHQNTNYFGDDCHLAHILNVKSFSILNLIPQYDREDYCTSLVSNSAILSNPIFPFEKHFYFPPAWISANSKI